MLRVCFVDGPVCSDNLAAVSALLLVRLAVAAEYHPYIVGRLNR